MTSQVVINDIIPRTQIIATDGQTVFNTTWTANATTDIVVYARAEFVEPDDATQEVSSSLYTVTFVGNDETVRVTFNSGRDADDVITIVRNTPAERTNLYTNTNFTPSMLNQDFGILTLVDQQAQMYDTVVTPYYNLSATIEDVVDTILPVLGAGDIWVMNDDRTAIEAVQYQAGGSSGAPTDAKYILQESNPSLPDAQALEDLSTGFMYSTVNSGVIGTRTLTGTSNQIDISNGTGSSGNPTYSLSSTLNVPGTMTIQSSTAISSIINDSTMATATSSNISTSSALKTYIDSLVVGLNIQGSCVCGTTTALTVTYDNGSSGVGATLTNAGAQAALTLDGISPTVNQRVLVKNQSSSSQNGIYTVTNVGSGSTNWIMTRATDYDTPAEIQKGDLVILTGGTTQSGSSWVETATVTTIGSDAITFVQFTASLPVNVASGGTGVTSFTAYSPIIGGTTTTGALQSASTGQSTANAPFVSNGSSAAPGFSSSIYLTNILDSAGNNVLAFNKNGPGAAVNYIDFYNSQSGSNVVMQVVGTDTDVALQFGSKGAGVYLYYTTASSAAVQWNTGTGYQHNTSFTFPNTAASRTYTWPDLTGTVAVSGASQAVTFASINFGGSTMSNYQEGTFTPVLTSSGGGTCTYSTQSGSYTRIGNRMLFNCTVVLTNNGLSAGDIRIIGLPIGPASYVALSVYAGSLAITATTQIMAEMSVSDSTIYLFKYATGTASTIQNTDLNNTSAFIISGNYNV